MKINYMMLAIMGLPVIAQAQNQLSVHENQSQIAMTTVTRGRQDPSQYKNADLINAIAVYEGVDQDQIIAGDVLARLGTYLGLKGGRGGEFIYSVPGYPAMADAAAATGGTVIAVPLNANKENDFPAIKEKINARTQAIYLVNPHSPSGTIASDHFFHNFLHVTSKKTLIVVDEVYLEYADNFKGRTAVNNIKNGDNVIVFRAFAKAYGQSGLAFSYAIAPKSLAASLKKAGLGNAEDLKTMPEETVMTSLNDTAYTKNIHENVTTERSNWNKILDELHLKHTDSRANFILFDIRKPYEEVTLKFKQAGISIPRSYAASGTWIKIMIGLPEENSKAQEIIRQLAD